MVLAWIVFPLVLGVLSLGCGLLVEQLAGIALPGALLLPLGLAVLVVEADLATMTGATATLAAPARDRARPRRLRPRQAAASADRAPGRRRAARAPSRRTPRRSSSPGKPTFAGYITLDDTATWLALTDRVMDHGRTLSGLAPSTYQQVLDDYLHAAATRSARSCPSASAGS